MRSGCVDGKYGWTGQRTTVRTCDNDDVISYISPPTSAQTSPFSFHPYYIASAPIEKSYKMPTHVIKLIRQLYLSLTSPNH